MVVFSVTKRIVNKTRKHKNVTNMMTTVIKEKINLPKHYYMTQ